MIEFSMTEIVLLIANVIGWAMYFKTAEEKSNLSGMLKVLFMQPEKREEIFEKFDEFKKKNGV
jgi:hypothetical protein